MPKINRWFASSLMIKIGTGLVVMVLLMLGAVVGVLLQVRQQDTDSRVINIAGRQRMLSQRIGRLALQAASGNVDASEKLADVVELFDTSLQGLANGDASLGLPAAPPHIVPQLKKIDDLWQSYKTSAQTVIAGAEGARTVQMLATDLDQSLQELLQHSDDLVKQMDTSNASAKVVDLAGHQRMLSARMAQSVLRIANGEPEWAVRLVEDARTFDQTLGILRHGDATLNLPPVSASAQAQIDTVESTWNLTYADIQRLAGLTKEYEAMLAAVQFLIENNEALLTTSDEAVSLFEIWAKGKVNALEKFLAEVVVVFIVVFASMLWLTQRAVIRPVKNVVQVASKVAEGDMNQMASVTSQDEIGVMARAFNQMTNNLRQMIAAEKQAKESLQNTVVEYVAFADKISAGDLSGQLALQGEADDPLVRLGQNINTMVDNLRQRVRAEQEAREYLEQTVDNYLTFVERVAGGDLTARLSLDGRGGDDALVTLGRNLNGMVERLGELAGQIREATANITAAAAEILAATTQQASGANEQSAAISQTSTTIDEVKTIVEQTFAKAQGVAEQAQQTSSISQVGQQAVVETVAGMNQIKEKVEGIAENILALSEQTQQIGEITTTINEIASQSNLLALNASVEAARAGEHGKGFAVVALEVRNLAEQSKQATVQVREILNQIQRATNAAVMATEEGSKGVDEGVSLTGQAGETIEQLAASIAENTSAAQQIVASAQQQTTGMEQIALAMQNIDQTTVQNLASTQQAEKVAQDLSSLAQQLETLVARYKLSQ